MEADFGQISVNIKNQVYTRIGSGSGRRVYDLGYGYVVKMAKNRKGIAQNETEYQIASADHSRLFAKIPHVSKDFNLLIMEKAERIKDISEVWRYFNVKSNKEFFQLEELKNISSKYDLLLQDLSRSVNWGRINGRPVIIDYGFTRRVKKQYYSYF